MITYLKGDATSPIEPGKKFIIHICNCNNGFGKGFVLALKNKWPKVEQAYRSLFKNVSQEKWLDLLGLVQIVKVDADLYVVNMIAQKGYGKNNQNKHKTDEPDTEIPLQYDALKECLENVAKCAVDYDISSIHMPRIGCGLAGGTWDKVGPIVEETLERLKVFVYDY